MKRVKQFIAGHFTGLKFFYQQMRYRIFLLVALSILIGALDGFGLAMFLPLLQTISQSGAANDEMMGNLEFIVSGMKSLGLNFTLISVLGVMVTFFVLKGIASFVIQTYRVVLQQRFVRDLRMQILLSFNQIKYKYFVITDPGRVQNTMTAEVERVSQSFLSYTSTMEQFVLVVVYMSFAFFIDFRFALLICLGGALTNYLYKTIYKHTKSASGKFTSDSHAYQGQILQYISNFKYLKATAILGLYAKRIQNNIILLEYNRRKIGVLNAFLQSAREPLLLLIVAGVIIIQTNLFHASILPIFVSLLLFYRALNSLITMQNSWNNYMAVSGSLENMTSFQRELTVNKEKRETMLLSDLFSCIELRNVNFSYASETILEEIDLKIIKNETVAVIGESGSGKTTLANLLAGLIPVDSGIMLIDGNDRNNIDIQCYQKRIGYITQEAVVFNDTIYNNITLWADQSDENRKLHREALKKAAIDTFVLNLPEGSETLLGNNGINLSGGQRQRISIARELFKEIDILIMDEATSSLDSETEKAIQNSIDSLKGQYTIIIIAHRISTIRKADRIVLLSEGRIKAIGSYDELLAKTNSFKQMIELQEL